MRMLAPLALLAAVACAEGTPQVRGSTRTLPTYEGQAAELFDDGIEPVAVGFQAEVRRPGAPLRDRTQSADSVTRVRVVTVTSGEQDGRSWQLGMRVVERLAGGDPGDLLALQIRLSDPAAGVLRARAGRLVGSTFVLFLREFAGPAGDGGAPSPQTHFHVSADTKATLDAVHEAALLGEVR